MPAGPRLSSGLPNRKATPLRKYRCSDGCCVPLCGPEGASGVVAVQSWAVLEPSRRSPPSPFCSVLCCSKWKGASKPHLPSNRKR